MASKDYLIKILKENKVFEKGHFVLASGKESDYYVNMKKAITNPEILKTIAELISEKIEGENIDKIAGPALGAVPIAVASSLNTKIPLLMIRKEKKGYGTSKQIEGELNTVETGNTLIFLTIDSISSMIRRIFISSSLEERYKEFKS